MFEKFGRMSLEDINKKAEELVNKDDLIGLRLLAEENGIPVDLADIYINGDTDELCEDAMDAAIARIDLEADDIGAEEIYADWAEYIRSLILTSEDFANDVMNPEKSFIGCVGRLAAYSITHAEPVPKEIIKEMDAAVTDAQLKKLRLERRHLEYTRIGMPGMGTAKRLIREYYRGERYGSRI